MTFDCKLIVLGLLRAHCLWHNDVILMMLLIL